MQFKHKCQWEPCGFNPWGIPIEEFCRKCGEYRHHLLEDSKGGEISWREGRHPNRNKPTPLTDKLANTAAASPKIWEHARELEVNLSELRERHDAAIKAAFEQMQHANKLQIMLSETTRKNTPNA